MMKNMLVIVSFGLLSVVAQAEPLTVTLSECANIEQNVARLECYDSLSKQLLMKDSTVTPPVKTTADNTVAGTVTPEAANIAKINMPIANSAATDNSFGSEHLKKAQHSNAPERVVFVISSLKQDPYKNWLITFSNGQKWKQLDETSLRLKQGEAVELSTGALGAVYLNKVDKKKRISVKRIK